MARYRVTILRTEEITFELDATSETEAENHYLRDGDEIYSETISTRIAHVEEV